MWQLIYKFASPKYFYQLSGKIIPWLWVGLILSLSYGLLGALWLAPADYQQGDAFRIIYVHVPSAIMSLMIYIIIAVCSIIMLIWRIKLADVIAKVSAPLGASFTLLALITGSLWGKPMWGTWWIWDARLTSELILLFLYVGIIALRSAIPNYEKAARACSILTIVGVIDIPIIHYSVYWWNTLHQQATLLKFSRPAIAPNMLYPLLAMLITFLFYYWVMMLMRARSEILWREKTTQWVGELIKE